ncbi:hypothetical protein CY35_06G019700 [Sphagnum magellanicum]|nr:hypothetical protein CY35_06G019700 [Sphagnum magellanicum]
MRTHSYRRQMMLEHAVSLLGVLAFTSISLAIVDWPDTPAYVPLCLHVHKHPFLWVLRWFSLLLLPVLTLVVPYILYLISLQDRHIATQGEESKHTFCR